MVQKLKNLRKDGGAEGFTIIEVLIVLAIAGLILLIVFLAVPALQRNARNTSRKNDVAAILGGFSEFVNNNNGTIPSNITQVTGSDFAVTKNAYTATNKGTPIKLGFYNSKTAITVQATAPTLANDDDVYIITQASCNGNALVTGATVSSRSYAAFYAIEPNATPQCQAS